MLKFDKGITESILNFFTLKPSVGTDLNIPGKIKGCNKEWIFVEIPDINHIQYLRNNCSQTYNITFETNRTPFQLQHNVLKMIAEHNLFSLLIDNPQYGSNNIFCGKRNEFTFNGRLANNLNEEQKLAVNNIVKATNYPLPYLIFGPPGYTQNFNSREISTLN